MKNDYEIRGDIVAIFINSRLHGTVEALVSLSELPRLLEFKCKWVLGKKSTITNQFYVRHSEDRSMGIEKSGFLHRFLTKAPHGMSVDHINHLTLDNTNSNLRVITQAENNQNRRGASTRSSTGIRGVFWSDKRGEWRVAVRTGGKIILNRYFKNKEDAERAVKEARMKFLLFSTT